MRLSDFTSQLNEKDVNRLISSFNERYDQTQHIIETKYETILKNLKIKIALNKTSIHKRYNKKQICLSNEHNTISSEINNYKKGLFGALINRKKIEVLDEKQKIIHQNQRELRTEQIHIINQLDFVFTQIFQQIIQKEVVHKKENDIKNKTKEKNKIINKIWGDYEQLCMINEINHCSALITKEPETAYM